MARKNYISVFCEVGMKEDSSQHKLCKVSDCVCKCHKKKNSDK